MLNFQVCCFVIFSLQLCVVGLNVVTEAFGIEGHDNDGEIGNLEDQEGDENVKQ